MRAREFRDGLTVTDEEIARCFRGDGCRHGERDRAILMRYRDGEPVSWLEARHGIRASRIYGIIRSGHWQVLWQRANPWLPFPPDPGQNLVQG